MAGRPVICSAAQSGMQESMQDSMQDNMQGNMQDNVQNVEKTPRFVYNRAESGAFFMAPYQPPFTITNQMLSQAAVIAEKVGRISAFRSFEARPYLRRNNRIRSIHSSLAIEANPLSLDEVKSVLGGKTAVGPQKKIQEVKNAYRAYDMPGSFNPYSLDGLKRLHGVMTHPTVREPGAFRSHNTDL